MKKAYGVKNVSQEGIPANNINVPYEVKQLMAEAMSGAGKRGVNLQGSAFVDRPAHAGSQTLSGGQNHREFPYLDTIQKAHVKMNQFTIMHIVLVELKQTMLSCTHVSVIV